MAIGAGLELSARQRGDFQTPLALAREVWATLDAARADLIVEPTFGLGAFLRTIPANCRAGVLGWEIHGAYHRATLAALAGAGGRTFRLRHGDVLAATRADIGAPADAALIVIGNPPWVTNAEQGALGGKNTGRKYNLKTLPGLDALTGRANFDICEAIILHLIGLVGGCASAQFALLGKFTVLRNLMQFLGQAPHIGDFEYHRIDTLRHFGAAVDAGLIKFRLGAGVATRRECAVYRDIGGERVGRFGLLGDRLVYDLDAHARAAFMGRGTTHYTWRQGVKHDLGKILELVETPVGLRNHSGEAVEVEPDALGQLYKSSDIYHGRQSRFVLPVYQRDLRDSLADLERRFPKLHAYLRRHEAAFRARKSRIYRHRHPFALFGIGEYTYAPYKVAIGALYPEPVFRLLEPGPRLPIPDDTCYLLPTHDYEEAVYLLAVLSLDCTRDFLRAISYSGDKRRFAKEVLMRVRIPPARECPRAIRLDLSRAWSAEKSFPAGGMQALREWLVAYREPPGQYALPGFADDHRDGDGWEMQNPPLYPHRRD